MHFVRHAVAPQTKLPQLCVAAFGHEVAVPSQLAANVCWPPAHDGAEHTKLTSCFASVGQFTSTPSQLSETSQTPAAGRQTVELGSTPSDGQPGVVPVQFSAA